MDALAARYSLTPDQVESGMTIDQIQLRYYFLRKQKLRDQEQLSKLVGYEVGGILVQAFGG